MFHGPSVKDAARLTGLSDKHIRRAMQCGNLPCSNVGTPDRPTYRFSRADIQTWMDRTKSGALPSGRKKKSTPTLPVSRHHRNRQAASQQVA